MADQFDDDPRATIPIVSGANFAQRAIRLPPADPVPAPLPRARVRGRQRIGLAFLAGVLAILVGTAAAAVAYQLARR